MTRNAGTQPPMPEQGAMGSTRRHQLTCAVCGRVFASARPQALYCSSGCKQAVLLQRRHEAGWRNRHRRCPRCGSVFVARRSDGVFCSGACRQAVHRKRTTHMKAQA